MIIVVEVDCQPWEAQGVKEELAMYVEKHGDTRIVSVEEEWPEQTAIEI